MWVLDPQTIRGMWEGLPALACCLPPPLIPAVRVRLEEERANMTRSPSSSQRPGKPIAPSFPGPPQPFLHLVLAKKADVGLRVLVLLECCPNLGLGLFGPAAPSCSQDLAGACWLPQRPELAD